MKEEFIRQFQKPDTSRHSFPFWAWNGKLDKKELLCQVRLMKTAGVGGFFLHSREGLETEYLSDEWMECIKAVVEEAKALDLYVWLYDEDRWPSGTAGGKVTSCGDAYRCKGLTLEILASTDYAGLYREEIKEKRTYSDDRNGVLAVFAAVVSQEQLISCRRLAMKENEEFQDGEIILAVRLEVSAPSEWFNQEAPPDQLNPACVKRFIQETHERYKAVVGEEFGKTIPGIFTDEPSLHDRHAYFGEKRSWIPWTYEYSAYFKKIAGYDFLDVVPWFYFQGENTAKIRFDYWHSITKRYGESYFKTISEWCEENHLFFTGHFLQEDKMGLSTRVNGAIMPNYQYQHVPGIDMLCEQTSEYMTVKQCTSVAHQMGKSQVITETYGCTGWDFTFEGQKWMGDWQAVLGVNRRCQHLALYSLRGCRKRDYPPSFNYNVNWWQENRQVDDYFARVAVVTEQGKPVRDILLLHPVTTVWSRLGTSPYGNPVRNQERDIPELNEYGNRFNELIEDLERAHLDCELGDELLMGQYASVKDGMLQVGEASYQAVVLPAGMENLLTSTCELLLSYMKQGGFVYAMKPFPFMADGSRKNMQQYQRMFSDCHWVTVEDKEELLQHLNLYRKIRIEEREGKECREVLYQLRKVADDYILFVINNSRETEVYVTISLPFQAVPIEMNLLDGNIQKASGYHNTSGGLCMPVHLPKTGSAAFYLKACKTGEVTFAESCPYVLSHPNILPLDRCRYRMDDGEEWSGVMEVWQAQKEIRERLGMRQIYHNGQTQRYQWIDHAHPGDGHLVSLDFSFEAEVEIQECSLVMERLEEFSAILNDMSQPMKKTGWFLDKEFEKAPLDNVRKGENHLVLSCNYRNNMELETIYLLGTFGVSKERRLIRLPEYMPFGDWTIQGLKHYCGSVTWILEYDCPVVKKETVLKLPKVCGVCVKIRVNQNETVLPWDFSSDISIGAWLKAGKNYIEVEVVGSPRNMMGPFHLKERPYNTHDASFCPEPQEYSEEYLLTSYGIMGMIKIVEVEDIWE